MKKALLYVSQFILAALFASNAFLSINLREDWIYYSYERLYVRDSLKYLAILIVIQFLVSLFFKVDFKRRLRIMLVTSAMYVVFMALGYSTLYIF